MINQQNIFDENLIDIRKKRIINKFSSFLHSLAINDLKDRLVEIGDEFLETLVVGPFAKQWAHNISQKTTSTIVNATDNLGPLSEFILNFSRDLPVFYGLTSVLLAVVLGVGAAMIRRVYSNWDDKRLAKLKK